MKRAAMNLELLFPTPVAFFDLGFELTKKEKEFLVGQKRRPNEGNESSVDNYILGHAGAKRVADRIQECLNEYVNDVMKADVEAYVTQSWVNWTKPGEFHHKHAHPNSLYSGVFYVDTEDERDRIMFFNEPYKQMKPIYKEWTRWNSESWWLPVKTGQIVIFPSSLVHMVQTLPGEVIGKERVSLAFNTFAKRIGDNKELTELIPKYFT
jgi:uncharacterized protein (TIGR02466 family)